MNNEAAASRRRGRKPVPQLGQKVTAILETLEEYPLSFFRFSVAKPQHLLPCVAHEWTKVFSNVPTAFTTP